MRCARLGYCSLDAYTLSHLLGQQKIAESTAHRFLGARIQDCYRKTRQLENDFFFHRRQLEFALQPQHFQDLEEFCLSQSQFESDTARDRQKLKFDALLDKRNKHHSTPSNQWVVNLSSKPLTQPQTSVLAKGLNLALPPKQISTVEIATCTKTALRRARASQEITDRARTQVIGILSKAKSPSTNLSPVESKTLKNSVMRPAL